MVRRRKNCVRPLPIINRSQATINRLHRAGIIKFKRFRRGYNVICQNSHDDASSPVVDYAESDSSVRIQDDEHAGISSLGNYTYHNRTVFAPSYFGGPQFLCIFCNAEMWYGERADISKSPVVPIFTLCCKQGTVKLPPQRSTPLFLHDLLDVDNGQRSKNFREKIRMYNAMFQFTSLGARIDRTVNIGSGPYVFKMSGQNYHRLGSLLPIEGQRPKYAQLYIYDTENELDNRMSVVDNSNGSASVDREVVQGLTSMLDETNVIVKVFRGVREFCRQFTYFPMRLRLIANRNVREHNYCPPSCTEIAGLIVGDLGDAEIGRDIIVEHRQEGLMRIDDLHPLFMSMQYPILFPYGDDGFHLKIPYVDSPVKEASDRQFVTMREYYSFLIQQRSMPSNTLLRGGRLFQQFLVDAYSIIEETRLRFLKKNQKILRSEMYKNVRDAMFNGDICARSVGKRIILPASFTGSPRYMFQNYQDAIAICRYYGYPTLFLTFTCNAKWAEIKEALKDIKGQRAEDRPDIVSRVFRLKLRDLMDDLMNNDHFGKAVAVLYTVEFQKRGLPHVHILLWLENGDVYRTGSEIDKIISAEIPDKERDPIGFKAVTSYMFHGPCGVANSRAPCMSDGRCTKYYPKRYQNITTFDEDGFPIYRRRESSSTVFHRGVHLDNRYVVPHNVDLIVRYDAHINVEVCTHTRAVKYLFKYINKGPDRIRAVVERSHECQIDEIKTYLDCRYLSPYEASWRIFQFKIHHREPSVQRLLIHLPLEHNLFFNDRENIEEIIDRPDADVTMFTEWMAMNSSNETARQLLYADFPTKFTWIKSASKWKERQGSNSIGRIIYVHPAAGEVYYMRLLLNIVRGPRSYEEIRTVNGIVYPTFKDACRVLGILGDDNEWTTAMAQASSWATGYELRQLFVTIILFCQVTDHENFFESCWKMMSEDIEHRLKRAFNSSTFRIPESDLRNYTLIALEEVFNKHCSSLEEQRLPRPQSGMAGYISDRLIQEELNYNLHSLKEQHIQFVSNLNTEQLNVYKIIREAIDTNKGGLFFVYGFGGTGKTYLWNTLISGIRSTGKIVLAVASSGIASLLLPGGRTAHSRFKIPLAVDDCSTCAISKGTQLARLIENTSLIVWDEAPMVHRNCIEALNKTLNDLLTPIGGINSEQPFGGKTVVLGGDFRQILPVVPSGTKTDIINATICSSELWKFCQIHTLSINMRLKQSNLDESSRDELQNFSRWLLDVGDGKLPTSHHEDDEEYSWIEIPQDMLLETTQDPLSLMVKVIYPNFMENFAELEYLRQRAVITPFNETVNELNSIFLEALPTEEKTYYSADTISKASNCAIDDDLYPPEYLNGLNFPGIPNHILKLKIGCVIMLLRNISQTSGLCNGTRLIITQLCPYVIEAKIIAGSHVGQKFFIPRIIMSTKDTKLPFVLNRKQFPVKVSYAMTINKSQGQTFDFVGLFLPKPVFTHGQLYVALSRVTSRQGLKIYIHKDNTNRKDKTRNVVYKEIFEKISTLA